MALVKGAHRTGRDLRNNSRTALRENARFDRNTYKILENTRKTRNAR